MLSLFLPSIPAWPWLRVFCHLLVRGPAPTHASLDAQADQQDAAAAGALGGENTWRNLKVNFSFKAIQHWADVTVIYSPKNI